MRCRLVRAVAATAVLLALAPPGVVEAGVCPLDGLEPFAGHGFPLEPGSTSAGAIGVSEPFPELSDFSRPILLASEPGPPSGNEIDRIYVVEQGGRILFFENRADVQDGDVSVLLDISGVLDDGTNDSNEEGLLGMAFDPGFQQNGYFYVNYTIDDQYCQGDVDCTQIVRYETSGSPPALVGGDGNPTLLLEFAQDFSNHNGGMLAFGPEDGLLYIAIGDGGSGNDPNNRAQTLSSILGSLARIDPHAPESGYIPPDNPFVDDPSAAQEIFHYGLRNPWRFSFDRLTGDLWIGDVGQTAREEIDFVENGTPGGLNFGWRRCEGTRQNVGTCNLSDPDLVFPVIEYGRGVGSAVTGGYVYRGTRTPSLYGQYLYADFGSSAMFAWNRVDTPVALGTLVTNPSSFGEDQYGELYVVSLGGSIHWFEELEPGSGGGPPPTLLSETGLFADVANLVPAPGLVEYEVNSQLWSDRALKRRWIALPAGASAGFAPTGAWNYPVGTAFVKHFELPVAPQVLRRLETRVLLRQQTGWVGYSYRWNAAETDAALLPGALDEVFDVALPGLDPTQTWHYPSPSECLGCHTPVGGRVLGARTRQLNRPFDYAPSQPGVDEQLEAWSCGGLLDTAVPDAGAYEAFAAIDDESASTYDRARAYLASNCSFCHQPGSTTPTDIDLRFDTLVAAMNLVGEAPGSGDLGVPGALRVDAGDHLNSVLWLRAAETDASLRMAAGTRLPDPDALAVLADWIDVDLADPDGDGLASFEDNCPQDENSSEAGPNDQDDSDADGIGDVCECSYAPGLPVVDDADFDRSGAVDSADRQILSDHYGQSVGTFDEGDANCDGVVDGADYTIWADALLP